MAGWSHHCLLRLGFRVRLKYSAVIMDKAHERSLNTDMTKTAAAVFGIVKKARAWHTHTNQILHRRAATRWSQI